MDAHSFAEKISSLRPSTEEGLRLGYDQQVINILQSQFNISKIGNAEFEDPILDLIANYDLSQLDINDIAFFNEILEYPDYYLIANCANGDDILLSKINGRVFGFNTYGDVETDPCADSSSQFLDALIEVLTFVREKFLNRYKEALIQKRSREVAYVAALIAGGEHNEAFYESLLWVSE